MRPPLLRTGFTMLFVLAFALSCREEQSTEVAKVKSPKSPDRRAIETYFDNLKPGNENEAQELLDLKNAIDFSKINRYVMTNNEDLLIADVGRVNFERGSVLKALFFVQQGEIVRSNLVAFDNAQADHNSLILSISRRRFNPASYNGRITYYSVYRNILFFNVIDGGLLSSSGITQSKKSSKAHSASRTEGCIDWYLITTYHYAGGGTSTSETYLNTTCGGSGECQSVRMQGRTNCGGGGNSASAGPALPGFPIDGDRYIYTEPDGKTTTYLFDAASQSWTVYLVVLPAAIVQSQYTGYSYLASDGPPADNTFVKGFDGLLYVYDAWSNTWEGGPEFYFGGRDPALTIRDRPAYFHCFRTSRPATLTIYADQPRAGSSAPISGTDVGHAWLSISQTVNGRTVTRVFGFYPQGKSSPLAPSDPSTLVNDAGHAYDVSVTIPLTAMDLAQMINYISNQLPDTYDLNSNNCTDFVVDACRAAGITLPENESEWVGGGGLCPGQFGEDLRSADIPGKTEVRDTDGGTAPEQAGDC